MPTEVLSLIANSGIQFHQAEVTFDASALRQQRVRFTERFDAKRSKFWIEEVVQLPGDGDQWCLRSDLEAFGWISPAGKISSNIKIQDLQLIAEDEFFEVSNFNQIARHFERKWIPLPYFKPTL